MRGRIRKVRRIWVLKPNVTTVAATRIKFFMVVASIGTLTAIECSELLSASELIDRDGAPKNAVSDLRIAVASTLPDLDVSLLRAVRNSDSVAIRRLIKEGANVNAQRDWDLSADGRRNLSCGTTPLLEAIRVGRPDIVDLLVQSGADVNLVRTYRQRNPNIAWAGASCTPLTQAAILGKEEIVKILIRAGAAVDGETDFRDYPLKSAAWNGHSRVVATLIEAGADLSKEDKRNQPVVLIASKHVDVIRLLVKAGLSESQKILALGRAAFDGALPTVEFLLQSGVDPNGRDTQGETALMSARTSEVAATLVAAGADVNAMDRSGATPVFHIASTRDEEGVPVASVLIHSRADVNKADASGRTALMEAAGYGRRGLAEKLIAARAEVNTQRKDGQTALMLAAQGSYYDIVGLLVRAGANVNMKDRNEETALMKAASSNAAASGNDCETIRALLSAGADVMSRRRDGKTALGLARDNRTRCASERLVAAGAK